MKFQSTHPVWGATGSSLDAILQAKFQSTHPVWGATSSLHNDIYDNSFQSTHPVWGATRMSISLLEYMAGFNPRTPCGVRHNEQYFQHHYDVFQSTHPVWGATLYL